MLGVVLVVVWAAIATQPQAVADVLLRQGAHVVVTVTERPQRTLAVSGVLLGVVWIGVGLGCAVQGCFHRKGHRATEIVPTGSKPQT